MAWPGMAEGVQRLAEIAKPKVQKVPCRREGKDRTPGLSKSPMSRHARIVPVLALFAGLAVQRSATAQEARPTALPEEPETVQVYPSPDVRFKLVLGGLGTTAVFYGAAAGMSYLYPDAPGAEDLRIPVAGPWLAIAHNGCAEDDPDCSVVWKALRTVITAIDGLGQAGGLGIVLEALFVPTQERAATPVHAPAPKPAAPKAPPSVPAPGPSTEPKNLYFLPMPITVGARGLGIGLTGRF
jgi:hypothetical protein